MSGFDEVIYFESGINTQFLYPRSSETTNSLYKDMIKIHWGVLLVCSVISSSFRRSRKIVRNSSVKESTTRVCKFILIAQLMAHNSMV